MDKETATIALVLVAILAIFVAIQPILPSNPERFSELGVLGPNQTIANYPTSLSTGQSFLLYGYIGNHEGAVDYYQMLIKLGNQTTQISNQTSSTAPLIGSYSQVIDNNQSVTFPINLSINETGTNLKLIFELWSYNVTTSSLEYTGLWNQLYVNVTGT
ncbi:MAG: DUF1616 domain-containing protein [Nitrososphaerota archaeon]|nr:DUF1616 domain-containing protein [Nitrososphaerota archaeon]